MRFAYLCAPMPAVSVIIPVYKVEPYVARCARSLFEQTLEDIEFIFVDDCSPDRSIEIVKEVLADYPDRKEQVRFVRTPRNGGLARARVFGLKFATGDYIIHCDSDDAVMPDAYRLMYEKAVAEDLDIVTCDFQVLGHKGGWVQSQYSTPGNELADIFIGKVWPNVWSRMSRRSLWDDMMVPRADMWEDLVYSAQTINKAHRIGYVPLPLYLYYRRLDSICFAQGKKGAIKRWSSQVANVEQVLEYLSGITPVTWKPSDVISLKYRSRSELTDYVQIPQVYRRWRNTFPEIDGAILRLSRIDNREKFDYCLIRLHLYHLWTSFYPFMKNTYRSVRRILRIAYYRVFYNCTPPVGKSLRRPKRIPIR